MKLLREAMNAARLPAVDEMSLQVVCVGPGSLKSQPPMAIQVCSLALLSAVNCLYMGMSAASPGTTSKVDGLMLANARFK